MNSVTLAETLAARKAAFMFSSLAKTDLDKIRPYTYSGYFCLFTSGPKQIKIFGLIDFTDNFTDTSVNSVYKLPWVNMFSISFKVIGTSNLEQIWFFFDL